MFDTIPWWAYLLAGGISIGLILAVTKFAKVIVPTNRPSGNGTSLSLVGVLTDLSKNISVNTTEVKAQTLVLQKMDRKLGKLNSIEKTGKETSKALKLAMTRQKRMYDQLEKK